MNAALLHALGEAPRDEDFAEPTPDKDEALVRMRAASLKSSDRMMADGSHYDSLGELPAVVGLDGVGVLEDGTRVYCGGPRPPYGTMAEQTVVPRAYFLPIPDAVDELSAAALPNPAMSSWLALEWRARLEPGETVLVLGATGVAGKLAVQVARYLGAGRIVGAGRNPEALAALAGLGADATIRLDGSDAELAEAFARQVGDGYDVVLDYLWGRPTEALVAALTGHELMAEPTRTRLVQIGEMAGPILRLPAEAVRSSGLEVMGSGGRIPPAAIFETFPRLWELAAKGELRIDVEPVPLADVHAAWQRERPGRPQAGAPSPELRSCPLAPRGQLAPSGCAGWSPAAPPSRRPGSGVLNRSGTVRGSGSWPPARAGVAVAGQGGRHRYPGPWLAAHGADTLSRPRGRSPDRQQH
jgi:NADPH:quinone reductase-like Zn-dependent oxidoreductase